VFGFGSRNPQMRNMRLALLAVLLIAGFAFHDHGTVYTAIRIIYYVVIVGVLVYAFSRRSLAKRRGGAPGAPPDPGSSSTLPGQTGLPRPTQAPGWYPDQQDMTVQRYWDGSTFTSTRHWDGHQWGEPDANPPTSPSGIDQPH
jgi:hypothetical protein